MNLLIRILKFFQSEAHALVSKFESPVKLIEQGIRDLKKDFDESMKSVAQIKAIAIATKKELETKKQIAADYEQKTMILLQKAKNGELDESEADRLATEALKKRQEALKEVEKLTNDTKNYDVSLEQMSKKILELKNKIKESENEYNSLKARATIAKTTKKINQQLSSIGSDSTMAMIEDMKKGDFTDEEVENAKKGIIASIKTIDDEQDTEITYFFSQELSKSKCNIEQYMKRISEVTKDKVVNVANKVSVNTVYFLKD